MTPSKQRTTDWSAMLTMQSAVTAPPSQAKPIESTSLDVPADELPWQDCGPLGQEDW